MGNLNHTYRYVTGGDYAGKDITPPSIGNFYKYCSNTVINVNFDTSNVTSMAGMFQQSSILTCNLFDTSNVIDMQNMFQGCTSLITVPQFDTSNVTNMYYMFQGCTSLITVPQFDTSNVTNMSYMLSGCTSLITVPQFDTSNVTNMNLMLQSCTSLMTIPLLDCGKIASGNNINIFGSSQVNQNKLTDLGGFKDLGKVSGFSKPSYFLRYCPNLTKESVINVINNLYDRKTAGYSVITLPFHANSLALLSDEEKAIATNKGWTLATS